MFSFHPINSIDETLCVFCFSFPSLSFFNSFVFCFDTHVHQSITFWGKKRKNKKQAIWRTVGVIYDIWTDIGRVYVTQIIPTRNPRFGSDPNPSKRIQPPNPWLTTVHVSVTRFYGVFWGLVVQKSNPLNNKNKSSFNIRSTKKILLKVHFPTDWSTQTQSRTSSGTKNAVGVLCSSHPSIFAAVYQKKSLSGWASMLVQTGPKR